MKKVWPLMSFISLLLNRNKKIIIDPEKIMRYVRNECTFTDAMKVTHCFQCEIEHYMRLFLNH